MAMYQARDTASVELKDGATLLVTKGQMFHSSHELVKRHGEGALFALVEEPPEEKPAAAPTRRGRS